MDFKKLVFLQGWQLVLFFGLLGGAVVAQQSASREYKVRIVIVGDLAATDKQGWGTGFAACLADGVQCTNLAATDHTTADKQWKQALELKPDWLLIHFGDDGSENLEEPVAEYLANLQQRVEEIRTAGIRPVLLTPLSGRQWGTTAETLDRIVSSQQPYADAVLAVGEKLEVPVIDLHWRSQQAYQSLGKVGSQMVASVENDLSLNDTGAAMFGSMVAMDCRSYVPGLGAHFRTSKLAELQRAHRPPSMSKPIDPAALPEVTETTSKRSRSFVVARDGSGDFRTIQAAINAAPNNNTDRTIIRIKSGVYMGQMIVPAWKPNITLVGDDRQKSIISYALTVHDPVPPEVPEKYSGYGAVVLAEGFRAANLTIRQVAGDHGQAIALRIDGDRAILRDCTLLGWQDTLRLEKGRHYLRDCHIEGRVDYIYGGGQAVLENCSIHTKNDGYVTAASTPREQPWGFVFLNCKLTGTGENQVYLGRPWRPYASVTYLNCEMDSSIRPEGWHNWRNPENESTVRYAEYGTTGPGAHPEARVPWARQLTASEAERITVSSILEGEDGWQVLGEYSKMLP